MGHFLPDRGAMKHGAKLRLLTFACLTLAVCVLHLEPAWAASPFQWMSDFDQFEVINRQFESVTAANCRAKSRAQLTMRSDTVSQLPLYNKLLTQVWYKNRTTLIHLHNMALNRAFFFSYILQKMNSSELYYKQPNWMYYYLSSVADVNANPNMINGSALYFDNHCHYPNWYTTVPFNKTLPLFGPRSWRQDNYKNQGNWLREPTRTVVVTVDAGAGRTSNYTHKGYKMNPWYKLWLPDVTGDMDSLTKFTYYIGIKLSNATGQFETKEYVNFNFFGPSSPSQEETNKRALPVQFTPPYFDCQGSNKWVVSAVAPVIDFFPRYSKYTHLRRQRSVGVSVMDIDFREIDFNACDVGMGNPGPSYLSGIHRCKKRTGCKHVSGFGFARGGYKCKCASGDHYPWYFNGPFMGWDMEQATEEEFTNSYSCFHTDYRLALPVVDSPNRTVVVEGGQVPINSGGVVLEDFTGRRRGRSVNTTRHNQGSRGQHIHRAGLGGHPLLFNVERKTLPSASHAKRQKPGKAVPMDGRRMERIDHLRDEAARAAKSATTRRSFTTKEVLELAERVRELNENHFTEMKNNATDNITVENFRSSSEEHADKNNVGVDVEEDYQNDLESHDRYTSALLAAHRQTNESLDVELLKASARQVRRRHERRFREQLQQSGGRRRRSAVYDDQAKHRMLRIIRQVKSVTSENCGLLPPNVLQLPGDAGYGVKTQFEAQGRTALRLANFLSLYLQTVMEGESFGNLRGGGLLHVDQMFGEVIANVMGSFKIHSAGLYFDRYKFQDETGKVRELFGPFAYLKKGAFYAHDTAGNPDSYLKTDWFQQAKSRFGTNLSGLKKMKSRTFHRNNPEGTSSIKHEYFPIVYHAAPYELGFWTRPFFRCDGNVNRWVMMYVAPFFGRDQLRTKLEFRGVATIDVALKELEINQCPQPYHTANAFKNTARCDYFSTTCSPKAGFPFMVGSYGCSCRLGFEYWHADGKKSIEGSFLELEYEKKRAGIFSRFDHLYCRPAAATSVTSQLLTVGVALVTWCLCQLSINASV